jgi:hypothetical protein
LKQFFNELFGIQFKDVNIKIGWFD